jgi:hypothetical protein
MEVGGEAEGVGLGCLSVTCGCLASMEVGEEAEGVGLGCLSVTCGCLASMEVGSYMSWVDGGWVIAVASLHGGW